ncbi:MAG: hypothetical protein K9M57_03585 [Phycisphaerae bacterium]|nr:hypothetical protein [Phycisphaerae bacterium]
MKISETSNRSNQPNRPNACWRQMCLLLFAMLLLPVGLVAAQDYNAVERQLGVAVSEGELSLEQALVMMNALTDQDGENEDKGKGIEKTEIGRRIKAAATKGEISEKSPDKRAAINKKEHGQERVKAHLANVKRELAAAVKTGRISKEIAAKKYKSAEQDVMRRMAGQERQRDPKRITQEDFARVEKEIRKAVADGKISAKDARARLQGMRKRMNARSDRNEDINWNGIKRRIEGAVKAGKMTRKQADAKYREIKKQSKQTGE